MALLDFLRDDTPLVILLVSLVGWVLFNDVIEAYVVEPLTVEERLIGVIVISFIVMIYASSAGDGS